MEDPVKLRFYSETYAKENRNLRLVEEFLPMPQKKSITGKFYAKHEAITTTDPPPEFIRIIEKSAVLTPKDIFTYKPPCVNMDYGWFAEPFIPRTSDPRLSFRAKQCDFIEHELKLRQLQKGVPVVKFKGLPFKTQ